MESITEITRFIRDYRHKPRHLEDLISDLLSWNQIWSACDVIDDAELAIVAYEQGAFESGSGEAYIAVYGLLQVLFVQQDAALHLCEALQPLMKVRLSARLREIRELRNFSVGHPTKTTRNKKVFSNGISRSSLSRNGFELFSFSVQDKTQITHVNIPDMIRDQRLELLTMLGPLVEDLKARDAQHKARFRGQLLQNDFAQVLYAIEKIYEALRGNAVGMGSWGVQHLETALEEFEGSLKARGESLETYDAVKYACMDIAYPLSELKHYLAGEVSEIASIPSALVFVGYLAEGFSHLMDLAREIDADYESGDSG